MSTFFRILVCSSLLSNAFAFGAFCQRTSDKELQKLLMKEIVSRKQEVDRLMEINQWLRMQFPAMEEKEREDLKHRPVIQAEPDAIAQKG